MTTRSTKSSAIADSFTVESYPEAGQAGRKPAAAQAAQFETSGLEAVAPAKRAPAAKPTVSKPAATP